MMKHQLVVKELPVGLVERDRNQPRHNLDKESEKNRLFESIKEFGIQQPLSVSEVAPNRYILLDGHRRYICAQKLEMETIPCRIYPKLKLGEFEFLRFEIQNNRKSWSPLERANSLNRIKSSFRFNHNKDLSRLIGLSETVISGALNLRDLNLRYIEMMRDYGLKNAFQEEFVRLDRKLCKINDIEVDDIVRSIFDKVSRGVISNAKDFRRLGRVFLRATANKAELYAFLTSPDMTVEQLIRKTDHSKTLFLAEELKDEISFKLKSGLALSSKERKFLLELRDLFDKAARIIGKEGGSAAKEEESE